MFNSKVKARDIVRSYAYGHDFGQSETCGVLLTGAGKGMQKTMIPSVWTPGTWREIESLAASSGSDAKSYLQPDHYHLLYVGKEGEKIDEYYGQKVFSDRLQVYASRGDMERYWRNNYSLKALMVASGSLCLDQIYELHVVTGVPVKMFSSEVCALVEKALKGTFTFRLNNADRTMVVRSVRVIAEGAGALLMYGKNDGHDEGVIDIGGQTTDLYGARNQQPVAQMRNGKSGGVGHAIDLFIRKFKEDHGTELSLNFCRTLFRQYVEKKPYSAVRDVQRHDVPAKVVSQLISDSLRVVGQDIATFVESSWRENIEIERATLVGGGAYYFKEHVLARLPYAKPAPDPEYANAMGYAALASRILTKLSAQVPASEQEAG